MLALLKDIDFPITFPKLSALMEETFHSQYIQDLNVKIVASSTGERSVLLGSRKLTLTSEDLVRHENGWIDQQVCMFLSGKTMEQDPGQQTGGRYLTLDSKSKRVAGLKVWSTRVPKP